MLQVFRTIRFRLLPVALLAALAFLAACAARQPLTPEELAKAEANLSSVVAADPANASARSRLAKLYLDSGQYAKAVEQYEALNAGSSRNPSLQLDYGVALIGAGEVDKGYSVLEAFTHPTTYRISQFVREKAADLHRQGETNVPAIRQSLRRAWDDGARMDWEDRQDDGRGFNVPGSFFFGGSAFSGH